jgi:hypothetical protein
MQEGLMRKALLVVRAVVAEADRRGFDRWYHAEHLPDAAKAFAARRAWRGWSRSDPSRHYAFYQFADVAAAEAAVASPAIRTLVTEFDAHWGTRVTRTREIIEIADEIGG